MSHQYGGSLPAEVGYMFRLQIFSLSNQTVYALKRNHHLRKFYCRNWLNQDPMFFINPIDTMYVAD